MPFNAPATIPNVHYRDAPYGYPEYSSYPSFLHFQDPVPTNAPIVPPPNTILYDQLYNSDHLRVRCHIRQLLKHNKVTALPVGFPFRFVSSGGSARISHSSYEFKETLYLNDERETRVQEATFVYTSPDRSANGMMSWQIFLSARGSEIREYSNARQRVCLAHVEAPSMIFETSFGVDLTTNPRIILKALAVSIERGVSLTFQVIKKNTAKAYPSWETTGYVSGEIVLMETDRKGRPTAVVSVEEF